MQSLIGKLASPAQRVDFQRASQQCELSEAGRTFEQPVHLGNFYVMYSPALHAQHVVMRFDVTVIARGVVQQRYFARLSYVAKLLEDPMDRGQRDVGMRAADCCAYLVGARMARGSEQRSYHREPLGRHRDAALTAPRDEVAESLDRVLFAPPSI